MALKNYFLAIWSGGRWQTYGWTFSISPGIAFKDSLSNVSLLSVPTVVIVAIVN